jgi:hypothetical protein
MYDFSQDKKPHYRFALGFSKSWGEMKKTNLPFEFFTAANKVKPQSNRKRTRAELKLHPYIMIPIGPLKTRPNLFLRGSALW